MAKILNNPAQKYAKVHKSEIKSRPAEVYVKQSSEIEASNNPLEKYIAGIAGAQIGRFKDFNIVKNKNGELVLRFKRDKDE